LTITQFDHLSNDPVSQKKFNEQKLEVEKLDKKLQPKYCKVIKRNYWAKKSCLK
jgi:hypothetical protein